ncbi:hypothetical protein V3C99_003499, partial [Haemonchus contortus]
TPHWLESSGHINALFSAIAIGRLVGTIPGPFLIHRMGVLGTMTVFGILSTFSTLAFPFAVRFGFVTVFVMRALQVLHYDVTSTGFTTALPYILSAIVKFIVGPISDRATCVSDKWRLVLFAAASQGIMALAFLALVFLKAPSLSQIAYTIAIVSSGVNVVGTMKCAQMVARQHVHIVMAVSSFLACATVLLLPVAVNAVCPDNTPEQWSRLFFGISIIVIASSTPFVFLVRSEPAPWTGNKIHALPETITGIRREDGKIESTQSS